jgi:hypothetical protein
MKFSAFSIPSAFLVATMLIFTACEKEGPAGPAGPAGAQGPAGPTGPTGPTGPAGTANVFYSSWLDVTFTPEVDEGDTTGWVAQIPAPRLVDSVLGAGDVKVYLNLNTAADPSIVPLPLDAFVFGVILTPIYEIGQITLFASDDVSTRTANNEKSLQYRYVVIPGGTAASPQGLGGVSKPKINWNNYAEVQRYLGLKD